MWEFSRKLHCRLPEKVENGVEYGNSGYFSFGSVVSRSCSFFWMDRNAV
jgi:hypothetical protein